MKTRDVYEFLGEYLDINSSKLSLLKDVIKRNDLERVFSTRGIETDIFGYYHYDENMKQIPESDILDFVKTLNDEETHYITKNRIDIVQMIKTVPQNFELIKQEVDALRQISDKGCFWRNCDYINAHISDLNVRQVNEIALALEHNVEHFELITNNELSWEQMAVLRIALEHGANPEKIMICSDPKFTIGQIFQLSAASFEVSAEELNYMSQKEFSAESIAVLRYAHSNGANIMELCEQQNLNPDNYSMNNSNSEESEEME